MKNYFILYFLSLFILFKGFNLMGQYRTFNKKNFKEFNSNRYFKENTPHLFLDSSNVYSPNLSISQGLSKSKNLRSQILNYRFEFALTLLSNANIPQLKGTPYFFSSRSNAYFPLYGISLKRRISKSGIIRSSFNYRWIKEENNFEQSYTFKKYRELMLKIGYEQEFLTGRIIPYLATELLFNFSKFNSKHSYGSTNFYDFSILLNGIGFSNTIGVKYLINKRFLVSAETTFNNFFAKERYKDSNLFHPIDQNETDFYTSVNKLSVSLMRLF